MALVLKDRVLETCTSPGTGAVTLLGAVTGYQAFSTVGNGNTCYYTIADQSGANWEVGIGTYATSGNTLTRTTILSSSNAGSTVNFATGTQNVFVTYPSEKAVYLDASGNVQPSLGTATFSSITDSGLTSGRVTYATTGGLLTDSANMTFNGTTLTLANDASISGLTVGKGGGAVSSNTAVGSQALLSNSTGASNSAFGNNALVYTTGSNNNAFGDSALLANTSGGSNVAFGTQALRFNTTASNNTAVGYQAGYSNTTGAQLVALGHSALYSTTTATATVGLGHQAGYSNTTGSSNTFVGDTACYYNTTGSNNTALGVSALQSNTTASNNTAVGYQAGYSNTVGGGNTFLGHFAGYTFNPGSAADTFNTFVGRTAGYATTTGTYNTFVGPGSGAGFLVTTGSKNTILGGYNGNQGGLDIRTSSNYIVLSDGDGNPRQIIDSSGSVIIANAGSSATSNNSGIVNFAGGATNYSHISGTASGTLYIGFNYNAGTIGSITQNGTTGVLYNLTSDYRLKNNPQALTGASEFIMALQPKTWDWWDGSGKGVGFIAHEFMEVAKYSGNGTKDEVDAEGKPVYQSIQPSSSEVMANLVALVQELKAEVDSLKQQLGAK